MAFCIIRMYGGGRGISGKKDAGEFSPAPFTTVHFLCTIHRIAGDEIFLGASLFWKLYVQSYAVLFSNISDRTNGPVPILFPNFHTLRSHSEPNSPGSRLVISTARSQTEEREPARG
jgi:hypothetical protein